MFKDIFQPNLLDSFGPNEIVSDLNINISDLVQSSKLHVKAQVLDQNLLQIIPVPSAYFPPGFNTFYSRSIFGH